MPSDASGSAEKPREWRRKVLVTARMRSHEGWGDVRILNVSSRGMMVRTALPTNPGTTIELRRGDQVMVAKVMWRNGSRAGLRSDAVLPVMDLMCMSEKAGDPKPLWSPVDSRARPRPACIDEAASTYRARAMEFAAVLTVVALVSFALGSVAMTTLGSPLRELQVAMERDGQASAPSR